MFHYTSLQDASREVRFIRVEPHLDLKDQVQCVLSHGSRLEGSTYRALSYTWGSAGPRYTISINQYDVQVSYNLWLFLSQARKTMAGVELWIDQICIDQANISERNQQVMIMSDIYRGASKVIVWLGEAENDSHLVMRAINASYPPDSMGTWPESSYNWHDETGRLHLIEAVGTDYWAHDEKIAPNLRVFIKALRALCDRPYWTRLWIIQEVVFAKEISLLCGDDESDWVSFRDLMAVLPGAQARLAPDVKIHKLPCPTTLLDLTRRIEHGNCALREILVVTAEWFHCSDVRDRVYGLRSLLKVEDRIPVDYNITPKMLFFDLVKEYVTTYNEHVESYMQFARLCRRVLELKDPSALDYDEVTTFVASISYAV